MEKNIHEHNSFKLSKAWFEFAYENDCKPYHTALYFYMINKANLSGWKEKVDIHTDIAMSSTGIGAHKTYKKALEDLNDWGFIDWVYRARNQHKCNQVTLKRFEHKFKALTRANAICFEHNTKADAKQVPKQVQSKYQSRCDVYKL